MKLANFEEFMRHRVAPEIDFHGGSLVLASGEEIPITEQMLQRTFIQLIEAWDQHYTNNRR